MEERVIREIQDRIETYQQDILEFTRELVRIPTENPPGTHYKLCVDVIASKLSEIGLDTRVIEIPDQDLGSIHPELPRYHIQSSFGKGQETLYFHGHYDVVPASREGQFEPYIKGNRVYGRGASDMKAGLAAMIYAIKAIKYSGVDFNGRIGLTIVPDEETGGLWGSNYLSRINLLGKDGVGMLTPEPTGGVIWNANRGAVTLRIKILGQPAHVGLQHQGINAFEKMLGVANRFFELKQEVESRRTAYQIQPPQARRSILMMGGQSAGGNSFNLVPDEFSFTVDRRINPEEDLNVEKQRLLDVLDSVWSDGIEFEVDVLQEGKSSGTSEDEPLAQVLARNIAAIEGGRPVFEMCPGLLEIRFYAHKGIPAFAYGPGLLSVSHGPDEHIRIEDIFRCTAVYALTALDIFSS
jgi:acetylornithine deacetylase/succinyl-diaminopimelate desuccinylase family protein